MSIIYAQYIKSDYAEANQEFRKGIAFLSCIVRNGLIIVMKINNIEKQFFAIEKIRI